MSRGRSSGDYRSPGYDPASDRWQDDDSWMSEDSDGNGSGAAWPYSQQGLGRSGDRGPSDGRGPSTSVTGDWQTWQSQPEAQPPSPSPAGDTWAAGQEFSAPWSNDEPGSSRSSGSGRWTPPGAAAAPGSPPSGGDDYYSDLGRGAEPGRPAGRAGGDPRDVGRGGPGGSASGGSASGGSASGGSADPDPWAERADGWATSTDHERLDQGRRGRSGASGRSHQRRDEPSAGRSRSGQRREQPVGDDDGGRPAPGREAGGGRAGGAGRAGARKPKDRDRRSSDRGQERRPGPVQDSGAADEDYDWIKYLGEGRGGGPAGGDSFGGGLPNRPMGKPRRDLDDRSKPGSGPSGGAGKPIERTGYAGVPGLSGRMAQPSRDPAGRSAPGRRGRVPGLPDPAARAKPVDDYVQPLYSDLPVPQPAAPPPPPPPPPAPVPPAAPAVRDPLLDSQEYARPLYPADEPLPRRRTPGGSPGPTPGIDTRNSGSPGRRAVPGSSALDRTSPADRSQARPAWPDPAPEAGRFGPGGGTAAWPDTASTSLPARRTPDDAYGTPPPARRAWPDPSGPDHHSAHNGWPDADDGFGRDAASPAVGDLGLTPPPVGRAWPDTAGPDHHAAHNGWPDADDAYGRDAARSAAGDLDLTPPSARRAWPDTTAAGFAPPARPDSGRYDALSAPHTGWPDAASDGGDPQATSLSPGGPRLDFGHEPSPATHTGWPEPDEQPWHDTPSPSGRPPASIDTGLAPPAGRRSRRDSGAHEGPQSAHTAWPDTDSPSGRTPPALGAWPDSDGDDIDADSGVLPAAAATRAPGKTRPPGAQGRSPSTGKKKPSSTKKRGPAAKRIAATKKRASSSATAKSSATPAANTRAARKTDRAVGDLVKSLVHLPRGVLIVVGCLVSLVIGAAGYLVVAASPPSHAITVPAQLGAFVKEPTLDSSTAQALRSRIVAGASGEVKNVVAAVYEQSTGPGTSAGPQIVVFIGGNLTGGASAGGFINGFMANLKGSFIATPGSPGGQAACAPGANGSPSECAWADNDTFGVVVSATLSATGLADEMRQMRAQVEQTTK